MTEFMAKHEFNSDNQPATRRGRGKSQRTLIIEALERQSTTIESFYDQLVTRALNPEDNFALSEVLKRIAPIHKSTLPPISFEFDESATPALQASQIMKASADGKVPPDVANMFISSIASMLKIDEVTELQKRLEAIEAQLNG